MLSAQDPPELVPIVALPSETSWVPRNTRVDLTVLRAHGEFVDCALQPSRTLGHLGRGIVRWADDEISVLIGRSVRAVGHLFGLNVSWSVRIPSGRGWARG